MTEKEIFIQGLKNRTRKFTWPLLVLSPASF